MSCEYCDSTEKLQTHHTSYNPEITITLYKTCHSNLHGHAVGAGRNEKKIELMENGVLKVETRISKIRTVRLIRVLRTVLDVGPSDVLEWFLQNGQVIVQKKS